METLYILVIYALRALQAEQNRSIESTATAEEDNELIASISDQSRFTPSGMDTGNKVVCTRILQELNAVASRFNFQHSSLCL